MTRQTMDTIQLALTIVFVEHQLYSQTAEQRAGLDRLNSSVMRSMAQVLCPVLMASSIMWFKCLESMR